MLHLSRAAARAAGPRRRLLSVATTPAAQAEMLSAMVAQLNNDSTRASTNAGILEDHGADESWHASIPPDVVVWPESTAEVSAVVKTCAANGWAVTPYGVGTALEGHVGAMKGGVTIDTTRMASVLETNAEDMDVRVQAGITRKALNTELRHTGLYFPIDPGADATLGGMASCGASGTAAVKFGTMKESTLGLTVVTADGSIVNTGTRARKSAAGYVTARRRCCCCCCCCCYARGVAAAAAATPVCCYYYYARALLLLRCWLLALLLRPSHYSCTTTTATTHN